MDTALLLRGPLTVKTGGENRGPVDDVVAESSDVTERLVIGGPARKGCDPGCPGPWRTTRDLRHLTGAGVLTTFAP